jgi:hypothetical protein
MRYALMVAVMAALAVPTVAAARPKPPAGCTVNDKGKPEFTCVTRFPQTIVWDTRVLPNGPAECPEIRASEDGFATLARWYTEQENATYEVIRTVVTDQKGTVLSDVVTQSEPTPTGVWVFAHCGEPVPA